MERIFDVRQASIGPWRRSVSLRGTLHIECLVRPFVGLLLQEITGGRFGDLKFDACAHETSSNAASCGGSTSTLSKSRRRAWIKSGCDAESSLVDRASFWNLEDTDGGDALSDEDAGE